MNSAGERIRVGDRELNVYQRGDGLPVLLVHGFPLDHTMWQFQLDALSGGFRLIAPDLRGFGRSPATKGKVTMERFADDLAELLDRLAIREPIVYCGLSMGGYIAWPFWRRYAARLRALVLCDTRAAADTAETARGRLASAEKVLAEGPGAIVESLIPRLFAEKTLRELPECVERTRRVMMSTSPEGIAAALSGMAERPDSTSDLSRITVPALCICGCHDAIATVEEMRGMAAAMPQATFREIPDAGHMSPLEQPAAVNSALLEFLRA
jgi:pimeloyl-ACP methyl ester carboxylesterase